jgi:catechol 2,3-dioxygenase-like lactoylglutathione lyase family enzyme
VRRQNLRRNFGLGVLSLIVLPLLLAAQQSKFGVDWQPLLWLIGAWTGTGAGEPGQGSGGFSFREDRQGQVLIRKSFSDYPATAGKPAYRHDDLMIVYPVGKDFQAEYFDNEGHVVRYVIRASSDGNTITFVSDEAAPGPGFRLTYRKNSENTLAGTFEIAPPGKPNGFAKYLEWTAQKQVAK